MSEQAPSPRPLADPYLPWSGAFPYDRMNHLLAEVGQPCVGRDSNGAEINDAFFDVMGIAAPEDRLAWDQLRQVDARLCLDFFLYQPLPPWDATDGQIEDVQAVPVETELESPLLNLGEVAWGEIMPKTGE